MTHREIPFTLSCSFCNKTFCKRHNLQTHLRTHTGELFHDSEHKKPTTYWHHVHHCDINLMSDQHTWCQYDVVLIQERSLMSAYTVVSALQQCTTSWLMWESCSPVSSLIGAQRARKCLIRKMNWNSTNYISAQRWLKCDTDYLWRLYIWITLCMSCIQALCPVFFVQPQCELFYPCMCLDVV